MFGKLPELMVREYRTGVPGTDLNVVGVGSGKKRYEPAISSQGCASSLFAIVLRCFDRRRMASARNDGAAQLIAKNASSKNVVA